MGLLNESPPVSALFGLGHAGPLRVALKIAPPAPGARMRGQIRIFERMFSPSRFLTVSLLLTLSATTLPAQARTAAARGGESLQETYNAAVHLQQAGKLSEATEEYRAFLTESLGEMALGYGVARDYAQAAPLFDEALALEPNSPDLLLEYAGTALLLGDAEHAKALASTFLRGNPGDRQKAAQAHQILGRSLLKLNQDQEARKEFEAAVALDPTFANGYDLAVACLDLNDDKCAKQVFGEMERSFGDTASIHMAFGQAYANSDSQPTAIGEFRRAIAENPRLPGAHYYLAATLLATGDEASLKQAEEELKKELEISPRDAMTYAALGKIATTHYQYDDAEKYLRKAIELDPKNPDPYLYLGQMYFNQNRYPEAEAALRQCIALTRDVSRNRYQVQKAHFLLGRILMKKNDEAGAHAEMQIARELANKVLSQDKTQLTALLDKPGRDDSGPPAADGAGESGAPAAAADPAALARLHDFEDRVRLPIADSYNNLGAMAAAKGDYALAVTNFERAAEWNPSLDGLDFNWGRAAFSGSQFADAVTPLSRYLRQHPEDPGVRSALAISEYMTRNYAGCVATVQAAEGKAAFVPQVEFVYADSLVKTGQIAAGTERLLALEGAHPEIPDVHRALGEALALRGNQERAMAELRIAIRLDGSNAASHYDLGKIELERGDTPGAIPELETAVHLAPNDAGFHEELAQAYKAAERTADQKREMDASQALRASHAKLAQNGVSPQD